MTRIAILNPEDDCEVVRVTPTRMICTGILICREDFRLLEDDELKVMQTVPENIAKGVTLTRQDVKGPGGVINIIFTAKWKGKKETSSLNSTLQDLEMFSPLRPSRAPL